MQIIRVGLLGLGTVGSGVVRVLRENAHEIEGRLGARLEVAKIAVKDADKDRDVAVDPRLLTTAAEEVVDDPRVEIVVELIGGTDIAKELVLRAIAKKKHVVTANKALLAKHGRELFARASEAEVDVFFEGAVGGGIPIIRTLREALASERVQSIAAILNGTTNFILSAMTEKKQSFDAALKEAQALGYAESDPTADVDGHDAAQKLSILASLGFSTHVDESKVHREGIRAIAFEDIENARAHGYAVKLLALAERRGDGIAARVHPAWVPEASMLAHVGGVLNAVMLQSDALGESVLIGRGAGALPTGSAVTADIIDVARNVLMRSAGRVPHLATRAEALRTAPMVDVEALVCAFYLRFAVRDSPGVLAGIAGSLGEEGVSLRVVRQELPTESAGPAALMVITHAAREASLRRAVRKIDALPTTMRPTHVMRIHGGDRG